jgi:hypothetical protein
MKFKISRSAETAETAETAEAVEAAGTAGTVARSAAKPKRTGLFATARAFDSDRPTRVYSLLLPPSGTGTRR